MRCVYRACFAGGTHAHKNRKIKEGKRSGDDDNQAKKQCKSPRIWMEENNGEQHAMADKCAQEDKHPEIAAVAKESEGTLPVYMKVVTPCNLRYGYMASSNPYRSDFSRH